jgi:hypothetical protein
MYCREFSGPIKKLQEEYKNQQAGGSPMSHAPHDHHPEDNSVNVKIAVFFVVVLAAITFIGLMS